MASSDPQAAVAPGVLSYDRAGYWYWVGPYESKHLPKEAGFYFNRVRRGCWATSNPSRAWALERYADRWAKRALRERGPGPYAEFRKRQEDRAGGNIDGRLKDE